MTQRVRPSVAKLSDLTMAEQIARFDWQEDLLALLEWRAGDPRLNAWEEKFRSDVAASLRKYPGMPLSAAQWSAMDRMLAKLDQLAGNISSELKRVA